MQSIVMHRARRPFVRVVAVFSAIAMLSASGLANAAGAMCSARSPAHRVALVELYSSEGCNSCPPADQWLSQWKHGGATQSIVPLALHVDYWNSLGWTDRFSQHRPGATPSLRGVVEKEPNVANLVIGKRDVKSPWNNFSCSIFHMPIKRVLLF